MAEGSTPVNDDQQLWWSTLWQTAKEKSTAALEFMKNDLTEFGQTVQQDAASAISATSSAVKQTLRLDDKDSVASQTKEGLQTFFGKISDAFYPTFEKDDDELLVIRDSQPVTVEKWHAHLHYIQTHPSNYSHKPEGTKEHYQRWLETFVFEEHQKEISDILASSPDVITLYTGIVPTILSNLEFWQRFFYRIFQANEIHLLRADLMKRADKGDPGDEFGWDDEDLEHRRVQSKCEVDELKETTESKETIPTDSDMPAYQIENSKIGEAAPQTDEVMKSSTSLVDSIDKMVIINSSPSSSDTDASRKTTNTEDEWEKDFDLEEANLEEKASEIISGTGKEDDWENWE